jgi:hypothetical protein
MKPMLNPEWVKLGPKANIRFLSDGAVPIKRGPPPWKLKDRLREWQGKRRQKEAASDLDIPLPTYRKFLYGKRTPTKLALAELLRRMTK